VCRRKCPYGGVVVRCGRTSYSRQSSSVVVHDNDIVVIAFSKGCQQNTSSPKQQVQHNAIRTMSLIRANGRPMNRRTIYDIIPTVGRRQAANYAPQIDPPSQCPITDRYFIQTVNYYNTIIHVGTSAGGLQSS